MKKWDDEKILSMIMCKNDIARREKSDLLIYHGINDYINSIPPWDFGNADTTKTAVCNDIRKAIKEHTNKYGCFSWFSYYNLIIVKYGNCYHFIEM